MKIRDNRLKEKYKIDDEYLNGYARLCGVYSTAVYNSLCRHADNQQKCFPSIKLIAEQHKIGARTVIRAIKKLEEYRIIKRQKTRRKNGEWLNNLYILQDKSVWEKKPSARQASGIQVPENTHPSAREYISQVPHRHTKDTHKVRKHIVRKKNKNFSPLSYEEIKTTYKTKDKIYKQKGLTYIKKKQTPLQERSVSALLLLNYFKDYAMELGAGEFFKHPVDRKEIENKNGKLRKQAIRFIERCDLETKKAKQVIKWFLENGSWCNYSPETCFSIKTVRDFETTRSKNNKKSWEKLE